ncbi:hypothetical protein PFISCL1PPCAC_25918, partial [Pristionchus fissidentatus]
PCWMSYRLHLLVPDVPMDPDSDSSNRCDGNGIDCCSIHQPSGRGSYIYRRLSLLARSVHSITPTCAAWIEWRCTRQKREGVLIHTFHI